MTHTDFSDLIIYTATLYGEDESSKVRAALALNMFRNAQRLGIKVVVGDGGSNAEFLKEVRELDNVYLHSNVGKNMAQGRILALQMAHLLMKDIPNAYFFWTEPEKDGLVTEENILKMITELREKRANIVVPKRTKECFDTLPRFQAWCEQTANYNVWMRFMNPCDEAFDLWYGPKMFDRIGAIFFLTYTGLLAKWDSTIVPVIDAYLAGKKVVSVEVDYMYDPTQKKIEEILKTVFNPKRTGQLGSILTAFGWKTRT